MKRRGREARRGRGGGEKKELFTPQKIPYDLKGKPSRIHFF